MKIDFRKVKTCTFDGTENEWDIAKELANTIYAKTSDIGEFELARSIYNNGEVDLTEEQVGIVKRYVSEGFKAFVQEGVNKMLETNKE